MSSKEFAAVLCGTSMSTLPAAAFVRYAVIRTGLAFNCQWIISITVIRYSDKSVTAPPSRLSSTRTFGAADQECDEFVDRRCHRSTVPLENADLPRQNAIGKVPAREIGGALHLQRCARQYGNAQACADHADCGRHECDLKRGLGQSTRHAQRVFDDVANAAASVHENERIVDQLLEPQRGDALQRMLRGKDRRHSIRRELVGTDGTRA